MMKIILLYTKQQMLLQAKTKEAKRLETRTIYSYTFDDDHIPNYTGNNWPYVFVGDSRDILSNNLTAGLISADISVSEVVFCLLTENHTIFNYNPNDAFGNLVHGIILQLMVNNSRPCSIEG